jgi:hypothetical protein
LLAETITAVIKAASNSATKETDSFRFMHLVLEETCHDVFLGAARELNIDPQKPQDGDFLKVVKKFLSHLTASITMRDSILRNLENSIRKPRDMPPQQFYMRFMTILTLSKYFEGIKSKPTSAEVMNWYFRAFPLAYQLDYRKNKGEELESMQAITRHMTLMHTAEEANERFNKTSPSTKEKSVKKDERNGDRKDRKGRNHSGKSGPDSPCRRHPRLNHTWGECYSNPKNKDKKRKSSKDDKKKHAKKHHSHHAEQSDCSTSSAAAKEEVESSDSEESTRSNKRMKHSSHHADGDELSADMDNLKTYVPEAFPDE